MTTRTGVNGSVPEFAVPLGDGPDPPPRHIRRTERAGVCMRGDEYHEIRAAAEREGLGVGPWLRQVALRYLGLPMSVRRGSQDVEAFKEFSGWVRRLGHDLELMGDLNAADIRRGFESRNRADRLNMVKTLTRSSDYLCELRQFLVRIEKQTAAGGKCA